MVNTIKRWNGVTWDVVYDKSTFLPLDGTAPMTGDLSLLRDPTANLHAATKQYVDALAQGIAWKDAVALATTTNITLSGSPTVDGYSTPVGTRVLVKNQSIAADNGIYVVQIGAWTRATDADSQADLANAAVFISLGLVNADTAWVCTTDYPTVGTTALTWVQFGGSNFTQGMADARYVFRNGDSMTGALTIDVDPLGSLYPTALTLRGDSQVFVIFESDRNSDGVVRSRAQLSVDGTENMTLQTYTQSGGTGTIWLQPRGVTVFGATPSYAYTNVQFRAVSTNAQAMLVAARTVADVGGGYIGFYPSSIESAVGTRQGYIGFPSSSGMYMINEDFGGVLVQASNGSITLNGGSGSASLLAGSGNAQIRSVSGGANINCNAGISIICATSQPVTWLQGSVERMRMDSGGNFMLNQSDVNAYDTDQGIQLRQDGRFINTQTTSSAYNWMLHIGTGTGGGSTAGAIFLTLRAITDTSPLTIGQVGSITQVGNPATGVQFNATSDKRLKTFRRNYEDEWVMDRLHRAMPIHFNWNTVPDEEHFSFFAQDLYEVIPEAVAIGVGEPGDEDFVSWGNDLGKLTPTLWAAVQILERRLTALENR